MLARRHLRIRVLQTLYTYFQQEGFNQTKAENELTTGTDRVYDLYLTLLQLLVELCEQETLYRADVASKFKVREKSFAHSLSSHPFMQWLSNDKEFTTLVAKQKISWQADNDSVNKLFYKIRHTSHYKDYVQSAEQEDEAEWMVKLYKDELQHSENINSVLEEKNIFWADSIELAHSMVAKTIKNFFNDKNAKLLPLFKDEEDDRQFMQTLLKQTIKNNKELTAIIQNRTQNWDVERIALVDIIILKMALTEVMSFNHIPVKVSINEYIDISKDFSTPQSKVFINGVLDKTIEDLKEQNRFSKTGRGLIES